MTAICFLACWALGALTGWTARRWHQNWRVERALASASKLAERVASRYKNGNHGSWDDVL